MQVCSSVEGFKDVSNVPDVCTDSTSQSQKTEY